MAYEFNRNQQDADKSVSVTMVDGGANTAGVDLEQEIGGDIESISAQIVVPAVAGLSDTKTITFSLEDSADNSTFAAVDPAISTVVTGADGSGSPAKTVHLRFPPVTRRYVRIAQTNASTAGTITGDVSFNLLF